MSWKTIGSTAGYVMAGTVATQLLQWVIMASIAHSDGPKMLGAFALAQAFAVPIQYLSWLSIRQRYLTLSETGGHLADFVFLRVTAPAFAFVVALALIAIGYADRELLLICASLFLLKYVEGFYDLIYAIMQRNGDARLLARLSIVRSAISGGIFVASYWVTRNFYVAMLLTSGQQAALLLFVKGYLHDGQKDLRESAWDRPVLRRRSHLALELLPVGISLVAMSLNASIPRFLLNGLVGAKELGFFAAINSFTSLGAIATGSLGQSLLQPLAISLAARAERSFWRRLMWPMLLVNVACLAGAGIAWFAGSMLLGAIYGPAFRGSAPMLVAGSLASGPIFAASIAGNGLFAAYRRRAFLWTQVSTVVFTAIGTLAFVPYLGLLGAFVAMALSACLQIVTSTVILRRLWATPDMAPAATIEAAT